MVMVIMYKAYKFRIYPNYEQRILLNKSFGCVRFVYNYYLDKAKEEKNINAYSYIKDYTSNLKYQHSFLQEVDSILIRKSIFNLEDSFNRYFKLGYGYPKYKNKNSRNSYTHNITKKITDNYDIITCEKLNTKSMIMEHKLSKSITDAAFSEILRQLSYKAKYKGKYFYPANIIPSKSSSISTPLTVCGQSSALISIRYTVPDSVLRSTMPLPSVPIMLNFVPEGIAESSAITSLVSSLISLALTSCFAVRTL